MTRAPFRFASCTAYWPTDPAAPGTSTVRFLTSPHHAIAWYAVINGIPIDAPCSNDTESGNTTTWDAGSTMYSAAGPGARAQWAVKIHPRRSIPPLQTVSAQDTVGAGA